MNHCNGQWKRGTVAEISNARAKSLSTHELCNIFASYNLTVHQCVAWQALCSLRVLLVSNMLVAGM